MRLSPDCLHHFGSATIVAARYHHNEGKSCGPLGCSCSRSPCLPPIRFQRPTAPSRPRPGRANWEARVTKALRGGKLGEAQRSWAEELVAREEALFDEWFRTGPVVVTPGLLLPPSKFETTERCERAAAARARAEFRSHRLLSSLTSEEAYVKEALRESGVAAN